METPLCTLFARDKKNAEMQMDENMAARKLMKRNLISIPLLILYLKSPRNSSTNSIQDGKKYKSAQQRIDLPLSFFGVKEDHESNMKAARANVMRATWGKLEETDNQAVILVGRFHDFGGTFYDLASRQSDFLSR